MTVKKALAVVVVLLLGAFAWFLFSSTPTTISPTTTNDVAPRATEPKSGTQAPQRKRDAGEKASETETPPPADDPSKWPIRVTTNVPGATVTMQVRLYGGDPDPAPETKTTDANGFVGFAAPAKDVSVHKFEFVARAEGRRTTREELSRPGDVRIEMKEGVVVRGRVTDDAGRPVKGATFVRWCDAPSINSMEELLAESAADGSFEALVELPGALKLRVDHSAFLSREIAASAPATGLVVVLERGLEVSGRVAFPDGRPVPGVAVTESSERWRATTDTDGRYVASGLARGPVTLKCAVAPETRTVEAGATNVDFVVKRSIARVRFLDAQGRPFRSPGMSIRVVKDGADLEMSAGEGPADGMQMMDGPAGAQVLVSATAPDGRIGSGKATFDETPRLHDVDVVLGAAKPTGAIRLVVRWESPEIPKAVYVDVEDEMGSTVAGDGRKRLDLDAAAAVEIPNVPAGRVMVSVAAEVHWTTAALDTLLVTATPTAVVEVGRTTEIVVSLVVGGRVRATVRDEAGTAVAPRLVRISTSSNGRFLDWFVHRNPDGGFTTDLDKTPSVLIDAVAPGRYVVEAEGPAGEKGSNEIDVVKGATVDVDVTVKAAR